jgi:hypothetical protein
MQWLILSWALTVGWLPVSGVGIVNPLTQDMVGVGTLNAFSTKFELNAYVLNHIRIYGSTETRETINCLSVAGLFKPYEDYFVAGVSVYAKNIEVGLMHECDHGVEGSIDPTRYVTAGYTEIYFKISGKTPF